MTNITLANALLKTVQSNMVSFLNAQKLDAEMMRMGFEVEKRPKLGESLYRKGNCAVYVTAMQLPNEDCTCSFVLVNVFQNYERVLSWKTEDQTVLTWTGAKKALERHINA